MSRRRALVPGLLLILSGSPSADSATVYSFNDGRTVIPISTDEVSMVAETVTVTPLNQAVSIGDRHDVRVDCVFHFVNEGPDTIVSEVGFPFDANLQYSLYSPYGLDPDYSIKREVGAALDAGVPADWMIPPDLGFTASVDGEEVPVRYRFGDPDAEDQMEYWPMWAVWDMEFPPGRDMTLRCSYRTGFDFHEYRGRFDSDFTYITRTGSLWRGPIGSAVVSITVPDSLPLPMVLEDRFTSWWEWTGTPRVDGRTLRWEMRDWEPDGDITLAIRGVGCIGWQLERVELVLDPDTIFALESPGSLFSSVVRFGDRFMGLETDALSLVRELREALLRDGRIDYRPYFSEFWFDYVPDPRLCALFDELETMLEAEEASVREAGYGPLMTMFSVRTNWHGTNLAMYEKDPSLEARFLTALSLHEGAISGVAPEDPVLESFYRLTAWFLEGSEAPRRDHRESPVFEPMITRDSVLAWWRAYPAMPLVTATRVEVPGPNVPFAFETPSPPFPATPQVNSVLNDDDTASGWRSDDTGGGHGEVLEAFVFPLPGPALTIDGFAVVNGFGDGSGDRRAWVSKLLVRADGVPVCTAQLLEGPGWQDVALPIPVEGAGVMSFEIIEAVPGSAGEPAGLSELRLCSRGPGQVP